MAHCPQAVPQLLVSVSHTFYWKHSKWLQNYAERRFDTEVSWAPLLEASAGKCLSQIELNRINYC